MKAWLDFGAANTGITLGTMTRYACLLSDGSVADLATAAALDEVDSTNLPGIYILDCPSVTTEARGKAWVTATPEKWSTLHFNDLLVPVAAILEDTGTTLPAEHAAIAAQISAIGSGTGAALNFAASDDNENGDVAGITLAKKGTQGVADYTATWADDGIAAANNHIITAALDTGVYYIDRAYAFNCGVARAASKVTWKGTLSGAAGQSDTFTFAAWNGATWDTRLVVANTSSAVQTFDIPLLAAHTTTAGLVVIRITYAEVDAGTLTTGMILVQAQMAGSLIGYAGGAVWVKTGGAAAEVPYVNGTADNPAPWANALVIAAAVGLARYTIAPGTAIVLGADFYHKIMTGRSYDLDLGADPGNDVHKSYFEGAENVIGMGTCIGGEAIFVDCQIGVLSIGEVDMVRCHFMGAITMTQDEVPYRFHDCTGIIGASIIFTGPAQTTVISHASGAFSIGGMTAGNTLYLDGDCVVELLSTCDGGTVYCSGNVLLTNSSVDPFTIVNYGATKMGNMAHGGAAATFDTAAGPLALESSVTYLTGTVARMQVGGWTGAGSSFDHTPEAGMTMPTDIDEFSIQAVQAIPGGEAVFVVFEAWDNGLEDFIEDPGVLPLSKYAHLYIYINNTTGLNTVPRMNFEMLTHPGVGESDFPSMRQQFQTPRVLPGEQASLWVLADGTCAPFKNNNGPEIMRRDRNLNTAEATGVQNMTFIGDGTNKIIRFTGVPGVVGILKIVDAVGNLWDEANSEFSAAPVPDYVIPIEDAVFPGIYSYTSTVTWPNGSYEARWYVDTLTHTPPSIVSAKLVLEATVDNVEYWLRRVDGTISGTTENGQYLSPANITAITEKVAWRSKTLMSCGGWDGTVAEPLTITYSEPLTTGHFLHIAARSVDDEWYALYNCIDGVWSKPSDPGPPEDPQHVWDKILDKTAILGFCYDGNIWPSGYLTITVNAGQFNAGKTLPKLYIPGGDGAINSGKCFFWTYEGLPVEYDGWGVHATTETIVPVTLANGPHGGPAATFQTSAGMLAQESIPGAISQATKSLYLGASANIIPSIVPHRGSGTSLNLNAGTIVLKAISLADDSTIEDIGTLSVGSVVATWTPSNTPIGFPAKLVIETSGDLEIPYGSFLKISNTRDGGNAEIYWPLRDNSAGGSFGAAWGALTVTVMADGSIVSNNDDKYTALVGAEYIATQVWAHDIGGTTSGVRLNHTSYMRDLLGCPRFDPTKDFIDIAEPHDNDMFTCASSNPTAMAGITISLQSVDERLLDEGWQFIANWNGSAWALAMTGDPPVPRYTANTAYTKKFYLSVISIDNLAVAAQDLTFTPIGAATGDAPFTVHLPAIAAGSGGYGHIHAYFDKDGWPVEHVGDYMLQPTGGSGGGGGVY